MPLLRFDLNKRYGLQTREPGPRVPIDFSSTNLSREYFPSRGFPYSILVHEIAIFGLLFVSALYSRMERSRPMELDQMMDLQAPKEVLYLPSLGGGDEGHARREGRAGKAGASGGAHKETPVAGASAKRLSFPGPQEIVSDPLKPTNRFQTVLQPALENPPILTPPVYLPNVVQMADSGPAPEFIPPKPEVIAPENPKPVEAPPAPVRIRIQVRPRAEIQPKPDAPPAKKIETAPQKVVAPVPPPVVASRVVTLETPKLVVAEALPQSPPAPSESKPLEPPKALAKSEMPEVPAPTGLVEKQPPTKLAEKPREPPKLEQLSALPSRGPDARNLLALSPMPSPASPQMKVPEGEARARVALSPHPNLVGSDTKPGAKEETPASGGSASAPATSAGAGTHAGDGKGAGESASGANSSGEGAGGKLASASDGNGSSNSNANGNGASNSKTGADGNAGARAGTGAGREPGSGSGSGAGAGAGPAKGAFSGITIQGGSLETGRARSPSRPPDSGMGIAVAPQSNYGMTIVSTGNSGGGLPDLGVFAHEAVYTVYLDMKRNAGDRAPSWTLQYAVLRRVDDPAGGTAANQNGLMPPFPVVKEPPDIPVELLQRYLRRQVIVYAIINREGKLEQMNIKQSPDPQLNPAVLDALSKWTFRPAELNGVTVSLKALLGIPLTLPE